jgi:DsbC/DsbD-like thiol-disulfide interchange protein
MKRSLHALLCGTFAAAAALLVPAPAAHAADDAPLVEIELLDGGPTKRGTYLAALRLTLQPGWKTYWRAPGDAGIPPQFSWKGSRNLGALSFTWPTPEIFETSGYRTIGYHDQLVLPVEVTPDNPSRPVRLRGTMELGVCKDVCVPAELDFDHRLDTGAPRNPAIAAALASRPYSAREAGVRSATCSMAATEDGLEIETTITMPSAGGTEIVVVEPGTPNLIAGETRSRRQGGALVSTTGFWRAPGTAPAVRRGDVRITVLGQNHAVDIHGCTPG